MPVGDSHVLDSIDTSTGERISLSSETLYERSFTYYNPYSERNVDVTSYISELNISLNGTKYTLIEGEEPRGIYSDSMSAWFKVSGSLSENDGASWGERFLGEYFGADAVFVSATKVTDDDAGGDPHGSANTIHYNEYSVVWDPAHGILGDDEWRGVWGTGEAGWGGIEEYFYVSRWVNGEMENITLWQEGEQDPYDGYDDANLFSVEIDQKPLTNGAYLVGTIFENSDSAAPDEICLNMVDWDGNISMWTRQIAAGTHDSADGHIIETENGATAYVTSYIPLEAGNGGADGYQTDFVFVIDGTLKTLTLTGADLLADDITALDLSDDGNSIIVTYKDASGAAQNLTFTAYWDAGLMSLIDLPDRYTGTSGNDSMILNDISEKVWALAGDDYIDSGAGFDTIYGGAGADTFVLSAGTGFDRIKDFSVKDGDRLDVNDLVGAGIHVAAISPRYNGKHQEIGVNVTDLDSGKLLADLRGDVAAAGVADAGITGTTHDEDGNRVFWAAAELANSGADKFNGTAGADLIIAGTGQKIFAGAGADVIVFKGNATAWGGAGEDLFVFRDTSGRIRDFEAGTDVIDLSDWGVESLDDLTLSVRMTGKGEATGDLLVSDGSHTLRLDGILASELSAGDFIFA